jgi:hypothetical protein
MVKKFVGFDRRYLLIQGHINTSVALSTAAPTRQAKKSNTSSPVAGICFSITLCSSQ